MGKHILRPRAPVDAKGGDSMSSGDYISTPGAPAKKPKIARRYCR
jgi:hypothetical protein